MKVETGTRKQNRSKAKLSSEAVVEPRATEAIKVVADISMLKAELVELAESMNISTKGTKAEIVEKINA